MPRRISRELVACPFLNHDDPRCASHFTLSRLSEAFSTCMGGHLSCPVFYRLLREQQRATPLTVQGAACQPELRATGS